MDEQAQGPRYGLELAASELDHPPIPGTRTSDGDLSSHDRSSDFAY